jgi:hypothetical protein
MGRLPVTLVVVALSCGRTGEQTLRPSAPVHGLVRDSFTGATLKPDWVVMAPSVAGATARVAGGSVILTIPAGSSDQIVLRRRFDVLAARGQRIRLKARVRMDGAAQSLARATISVVTAAVIPTYHDQASSSPTSSRSWVDVHAVMDVPLDATSGQIDLVLRGAGTAWFEAAEVTAVSTTPARTTGELSPQQIENLVAFTRAATLIRYLHPSDEVAVLDWNAFLPGAIERVLRVRSQAELLVQLRATFHEIAPTATFSGSERMEVPLQLPRGDGTHLVRWRRYGLGSSMPFTTYREGRDEDEASASALIRLRLDNLQACRKVSFRASGRRLPGSGKALLVALVLRPGIKRDELSAAIQNGETLLQGELPQDVQDVELGLRVDGRSGATLDALAVSCNHGAQRAVDLARAAWTYTGATDLYGWKVSVCDGRPCAQLQRDELDTAFRPERDVLHRDIGSGIWLHLPLAVWADARRTLPVGRTAGLDDFAIDDGPTRLAAIAAAWGTLSLFYPYFADQRIDWLAALPSAFREAAAAGSPADTRVALAHLMARLQDNHAKITHPGAPITGILPLAFRKFGANIVVVGGLPDYLGTIDVGGEVVAIDGIPAEFVYDRMARQVSAATEGLHEYLTLARMGMGPPGSFHTLRIRGRDGPIREHVVPFVSDDLYAHVNREPRPAEHAELAPGVHYVDLDSLSRAAWENMLPSLEQARAIILDFRGYANFTALEMLSHIANQELHSPVWQIPMIHEVAGIKYTEDHWDIRPQAPRFNAKIIGLVDGRSMSAIETLLQMFREGNLGVLVGETSGGTNGNVAYVEVPGGFTLRFTGMRAARPDGSTVHGHGFEPDHEVHPTLDGIRAGRDEILEAGVAVAKRLINP